LSDGASMDARIGALAMLADAGPRGATEAVLIANGFPVAVLAGLVRDGLAHVAVSTVRAGAGGRKVDVVRMQITDAGRRALAHDA
jgi:hypothetical protein